MEYHLSLAMTYIPDCDEPRSGGATATTMDCGLDSPPPHRNIHTQKPMYSTLWLCQNSY